MINRLDISGVHMDVGPELKKYATKKIGRLDRFAPKAGRQSMYAEIKLKEGRAKDKNERTCEVLLHMPHETLATKETTINMHAAIDIAEAKLRQQLRRYKDLHASPKLRQRVLARLKRRPALAD